MSNFTKSIVYSGLVMAAGLVAIFAIYNNMTDASLSSIEPAAGTQMGTTEGYDASSSFQQVSEEVAADAEAAADAVVEGAEAAADEVVESTEGASDATVEATEEAADAVVEGAEAAAEEVHTEGAAH